MRPEIRAKLTEALNAVFEKISAEGSRIFATEGDRHAFVFGIRAARKKNQRKPRRCSFPGCANMSIPSSHSLQRNGPLAAIAEEGHVLTPEVSLTKGRLDMIRIGIGEASTFPGFCSEHERVFSELERRRDLAKDEDIALQVFRTICREIVIKRQQVDDCKLWLKSWENVVNNRAVEILEEKLAESLSEYLPLRSISVRGTRLEEALCTQLARLEHEASDLETEFLPKSFEEVNRGSDGLSHFVCRIGQYIPVCLAGLGTFHVKANEQVASVSCILNIWPTTDGVTISMAVSKPHNDFLQAYLSRQLNRSIGVLEMVETWMVRGSDHWFIKPSCWTRIPPDRQLNILEDILDCSLNIGTPYSLSIFDELREDAVGAPDVEGHPPTDKAWEISKLRLSPSRGIL